MAAKPRLVWNNLWRQGTILTPSSEDSKHPATDTQIDTLEMYWKASALTSPVTIPINQGATPGAIDFIAILAHNIEAAGVVITLEGDDVATFDSGGFVSRTLTHNATNIFQFINTFTKQYVRLQLVRAAGNFPTHPQIATILCGNYTELNRRFAPEYEIGEEDFSEEEYSDSQVLFAQEKETLNIRRYSYQALNGTSINEIFSMFEECKTIRAFIFCLNYKNPNSNTLWVRNSELNSPVCRNGVWYWDMAIKEVR